LFLASECFRYNRVTFMAITIGQQLGSYEITALLGKGGMGEVYRARDTKLKRDVAIKILPDEFTGDIDRLNRFQREAEVLASLNHPNIAHIYGVEERALAMELVEGDSPRGPMPFDDAWKIASQIADALEYAHDKGIVHRDLKPANVKVTPEGTVKLLDFGLAKAFNGMSDASSNDPSNSPTISLGPTMAGVVIGTAGYMSPEQAKGKVVDKRADIWAWGVLLYELLTGEPMFQGEDASEILAQVLTNQPDFGKVDARARRVLQECSKKDPKQRLRDIGDAKRLLKDDVSLPPPLEGGTWPRFLPWLVAGTATLFGAVALFGWLRHAPPEPPQVVRFSTAVPISSPGLGLIALSLDGSRIAFVSGPQRQIHVRAIDRFEAAPLSGTEDATSLSFSPDGEWISYVSGYPSGPSSIKRISLGGGPPQTVTSLRAQSGPPSQNWGEDNNIYFSSDDGLQRVAWMGGKSQVLASPDGKAGERVYVAPQLLPDRRHVLLSSLLIGRGPTAHRVLTLDLQSREKKVLLDDAGLAIFDPAQTAPNIGYIFYYVSTGSIMAVPFDVSDLRVQGSSVPVLEGVRSAGNPAVGIVAFSRSGTLAYVPGGGFEPSPRTLVWLNREGAEEPAPCREPRQYNLPRLSRDATQVAIEIQNPGRGQADVWICDLTRGSLARITSENTNTRPIWTPDSKRVIFSRGGASEKIEIVSAPIDGGPSQVLATEVTMADSFSSDGKFITGNLGDSTSASGRTVSILSIENTPSSGLKSHLLDQKFAGTDAQFSPDGKLIAYQSRESGRTEIYVREYPGLGGKTTISTDGGIAPRWSRNGELFYKNGDKLMAVEIQTTPVFRVGKPKVLFEKPYANGYDVTGDGKRFLMIKSNDVQRAAPEQLNIVLNWFTELKQRVSAK
jgi:serine/threonine protein kinase